MIFINTKISRLVINVLLVTFYGFSSTCFAQENLEEMSKNRFLNLQFKDSVVLVNILTTDAILKEINPKLMYYWFSDNLIHSNLGGFDGLLLDGEYLVKSNEGKLLKKGHFVNGLMAKTWTSWYPNGLKKSQFVFKNGQFNGEAFIWGEKGNLISKYWYRNGLKNGSFEIYFNSGTLAQKGEMKNGKKSNWIFSYRDDGSLESKIKYKKGEKNGWSLIYDENGNLSYKQKYVKGVLIPKIEGEKSTRKWFWKKKEKANNGEIHIKLKNEI